MKTGFMRLLPLSALAVACTAGNPQPRAVSANAGCEQLGDTASVMDGFYDPSNVYAAKRAERSTESSRPSATTRTVGADVYLHAREGVDQTYAERVLSCHAAQRVASHPNDPLVPESGSVSNVSVRSEGPSLVVRIESDDRATANEIWSRANAFASQGGVTVQQVASR